jgi:serine/threonine protein kinase
MFLIISAADAAAGLMYLHEKHIVHADLALRNILVGFRSDGEARYHGKVGDFGLR